MNELNSKSTKPSIDLRDAARFWEKHRLWYNALLFLVLILWVVFTWPHFRPAMNLVALGKMTILALLANLVYCAGYVTEGFVQPLVQRAYWRRMRLVVWVGGMLLALVLANYWIADEIYPDVQHQTAVIAAGNEAMGSVTMASNMNFPAPLAAVGFLGAVIGLVLAVAAVVVFWLARKKKLARYSAATIGVGAATYFGALVAFSIMSRANVLSRGQEKYFCEIDCHLAYAVTDVAAKPAGEVKEYLVTIRTRFDETTTSTNRPKGVSLAPSPREVRLIDSEGREYFPVATFGTPLTSALVPGQKFTTQVEFHVAKDAAGLRLLLNTLPSWPDRLVIGDENSFGHEKTYFAL